MVWSFKKNVACDLRIGSKAREGDATLQTSCDKALALNGMANVSESQLPRRPFRQAKDVDKLEPKGVQPGSNACSLIITQTIQLPA